MEGSFELTVSTKLFAQLTYADYAYFADVQFNATFGKSSFMNPLSMTAMAESKKNTDKLIREDKAANKTKFNFCDEEVHINYDLLLKLTAEDHMYLKFITYSAITTIKRDKNTDFKTRWTAIADYIKKSVL